MSQTKIIKVLKESNKPLSSKEIAEMLNESHSKVCVLLNRMLKRKDIEYIEIDRWKARLLFNDNNIKRRMKLYLYLC